METALPELSEQNATGQIATIYSALRASLGIPNVNLVFRHMATVRDCLPWAWHCIGPLYQSGVLLDSAQEIVKSLPLRPVTSLGVSFEAPRLLISNTLDAYIRANPVNMICLALLQAAIENRNSTTEKHHPGSVAEHMPIDSILPMTSLSALPQDATLDLGKLTTALHGRSTGVIPSLFRHFASWPQALRDIHDVLNEVNHGEQLQILAVRMLESMTSIARTFEVYPTPAASKSTAETILMLSDTFPLNMAKMTILALSLRRAWLGDS